VRRGRDPQSRQQKKNTSPEQLATAKFKCGLMLNSKPAKKVATAQPSEPHIRAAEFKLALARDASV
jgi:hypothetical protein